MKNYYTEEEKRSYIERFLHDGFEYVGNYTGSDGKVTLKCCRCGCVFDRSVVSLRQGQKTICPVCVQHEWDAMREETRKRHEAKRERQRETVKWKHEVNSAKYARQVFLVECVECGNAFTTVDSKRTCCSTECSKRRQNKRTDRRISKDKRIDKDITVKKLYEREGGVCWICGCPCNLQDYTVRTGTIICGDEYPSIDHIVPICEGGLDSWDNVKLAHRRCNTLRYYGKYSPQWV